MNLEKFGWNAYWAGALREAIAASPVESESGTPGRVTAVHRAVLEVETEYGLVPVQGTAATVGDWVLLSYPGPRLLSVLPRRTQISRRSPGTRTEEQVLAANVDTAMLVMGLDGDFNLRRLERYLIAIAESGAKPLVVLNKTDLCYQIDQCIHLVRDICHSAPVLAVSALNDTVASALSPHLAPGESLALLGSSGAGKSTILNSLLGEERQRTSPVREDDSRGRHTTTARQLIPSPQGWLIFDLPGLREVQLWAGRESLDAAFHEIATLALQCRFRDCRHQGEPGCAVEAELSPERLESFHRLERELESLEARRGGAASQNTKRRWKQIHKEMRHHPKYKR